MMLILAWLVQPNSPISEKNINLILSFVLLQLTLTCLQQGWIIIRLNLELKKKNPDKK